MKCHFQWILCISAAALRQVIVSLVLSYFTLDFVVFKILHVLTVFAVLTLLPLPWGLTHGHVIDIHGHAIDTLRLAVQATKKHQTKSVTRCSPCSLTEDQSGQAAPPSNDKPCRRRVSCHE